MRHFLKSFLILLLLIVAIFGGLQVLRPADAATDNPSTASTSYQLIALPISAVTATTTGIVKFVAPWPYRVVHVSSYANAVTGAVTLDVKNSGGTSLLASTMTASTAYTEATLSATSATLSITDETAVSVNTAGTGTANNVTVLLGIKRQ